MSLTSQQLASLQRANRVLLAPLSYGSDKDWCLAVLDAVHGAIGVDVAAIGLAAGNDPLLLTKDFDPSLFQAFRSLEAEEGIISMGDDDTNATHRSAYRRGCMVYDAKAMFRQATGGKRLEDCRLHHEYISPLKVIDPVTMHVGLPRGALFVAIGHTRMRHAMRPGDFRWKVAEHLVTSLEAAANVLQHAAASRTNIGVAIDQMEIALIGFSRLGAEVFRSASADRAISADVEPSRVLGHARLLAGRTWDVVGNPASAAGPGACGEVVVTGSSSYEMFASRIDAGILDRGPLVLVSLRKLTPELPDVSDLRERYGLSRRECEVALVVARGASNKHAALTLGISPSTVRNHMAKVYDRVGIDTRKALALEFLSVTRTAFAEGK